MPEPKTWYGRVYEDGSFKVLARLVSIDGSGEEVQPGEGNCIQQSDITSITCHIYDLGSNRNNQSGSEITPAPTVTVVDTILDILAVVGWSADYYGYNFMHNISKTYLPNPSNYYLIEYEFTLAAGGNMWLRVIVNTNPVTSR